MLITIVLLIGGCKLVSVGLRGRHIGDHPVCARCKFDLFGKPPQSTVCPECGSSLKSPRAIQTGNRLRRPGFIWSGAGLLLLGVYLGALPLLEKIDFDRFKPDLLLIYQAKSEIAATSATVWPGPAGATSELLMRVQTGEISETNRDRVVAIALAYQADRTRLWNPQWGDMIECLQSKSQLSPHAWSTYLAQIEFATLKVRPSCSWGDNIPFQITGELRGATPLTTARNVRSGSAVTCRSASGAYVNGWGGAPQCGMIQTQGSCAFWPASLNNLVPGPQSLCIALAGVGALDEKNPTLFPPLRLTASWNLLPKGQKSVELYRDEELARRIQDLFQAKVSTCSNKAVAVDVDCRYPPCRMFLSGFLRYGGKEWKADEPMEIGPNFPSGGVLIFEDTANLSAAAAHFDLVFRPSTEAASNTLDVRRMLDHEFVIHGLVAIPQ